MTTENNQSNQYTEDEARTAVEEFRTCIDDLDRRLLEMHERGAHYALNYANWEEFVGEEFALSKSESYRLLDRAHMKDRFKDVIPEGSKLKGTVWAYLRTVPKERGEAVLQAVRIQERGIKDDRITRKMVNAMDEAWDKACEVFETDQPTPGDLIRARAEHLVTMSPVAPKEERDEELSPIDRVMDEVDEVLGTTEDEEVKARLTAMKNAALTAPIALTGRPPGRPRGGLTLVGETMPLTELREAVAGWEAKDEVTPDELALMVEVRDRLSKLITKVRRRK